MKLDLSYLLDQKCLDEDHYDLIKGLVCLRGPLDPINKGQISELGTYYSLICNDLIKDTDVRNELFFDEFIKEDRNAQVLRMILIYTIARENPTRDPEEEKLYLGYMIGATGRNDELMYLYDDKGIQRPKKLNVDQKMEDAINAINYWRQKNINQLIDAYIKSDLPINR